MSKKATGPAPAKPTAAAESRKKKRRIGAVLCVVGIVLLSLLLVLAGVVYGSYNKVAGQLDGAKTEAGTLPQEVKTETIPEYAGKPIICGLICGIDYDNETADGYTTVDKIGNTDMILYLVYNTETGKANILQIPRDVYVGDDLNTGGHYKINSLYRYAEDTDNRMAALAGALYEQLGLPTDFYVTIDLDAVIEIIDIVNATGDFMVYVPQDIVHPDYPDQVLEKGWRGFTGAEAIFFLRNRNYTDGDITRLQTQQYFYSALFREFKELQPSDLLMWMRVVLHRVNVSGISLWDIGGLAQSALAIRSEDVLFVRPSITGGYYQGEFIASLIPDEMAGLLNEYFRPDGHTVPVEELDIHTQPPDENIGKSEAYVRTMDEVRETEGEQP